MPKKTTYCSQNYCFHATFVKAYLFNQIDLMIYYLVLYSIIVLI